MWRSIAWGFLNRWPRAPGRRRRRGGLAFWPTWLRCQEVACSASRTPMSFRTSWRKSRLNFATNMSSAISPPIWFAMAAGAVLKSSCFLPEVCPRSRFTLARDITLQRNRPGIGFRRHWLLLAALMLVPALLGGAPPQSRPKTAQPGTPAPSGGQAAPPAQKPNDYKISVNVGLVVLHATVLDKRGRQIENLKQDDFHVYEDGVPQRLSVFSHSDIPVTMGIVIDDSGSMREKRPAVNTASLTFVKTSNPQDQVFVVNFNDVYYLDTPGDFASNLEDLKAALDKIDSRGGTALYDALDAAISHLKLGNRDKRVILTITDGED